MRWRTKNDTDPKCATSCKRLWMLESKIEAAITSFAFRRPAVILAPAWSFLRRCSKSSSSPGSSRYTRPHSGKD